MDYLPPKYWPKQKNWFGPAAGCSDEHYMCSNELHISCIHRLPSSCASFKAPCFPHFASFKAWTNAFLEHPLALFRALHCHTLDHFMAWSKSQSLLPDAHTSLFSKVQGKTRHGLWDDQSHPPIRGDLGLVMTVFALMHSYYRVICCVRHYKWVAVCYLHAFIKSAFILCFIDMMLHSFQVSVRKIKLFKYHFT